MRKSGKIILILGFLLIVISLGLVFYLQIQTKQAVRTNEEILQINRT